MASKTLFNLGLLLVLIAVGYQYRTDITHFIQHYTRARGTTSETSREKRESSSTQERQTPLPTSGDYKLPKSEPSTEHYNPPLDPDNPEKLHAKSGTRLFTKNELAAHGPDGPLKPILLAVLGRVYDVDKGTDYYGPVGGYNFFSGIDGSRAFVTGEFDEKGLIDDLEGFSPLQIGEIDDWVKFYDKDYTFAGKLIGR